MGTNILLACSARRWGRGRSPARACDESFEQPGHAVPLELHHCENIPHEDYHEFRRHRIGLELLGMQPSNGQWKKEIEESSGSIKAQAAFKETQIARGVPEVATVQVLRPEDPLPGSWSPCSAWDGPARWRIDNGFGYWKGQDEQRCCPQNGSCWSRDDRES